ncbi:MAG: SDR family oxidoreductase [Rubrivivax sp.]|nr:SDR family oxidoreductase [Rubrivivax sp.]
MTAAPLVYITGASSGIGQALAARYAQAGWRLALVARRGAVLREWAASQGLDGTRCGVYEADVALPDSIVAAGRACLQAQGLPDVVIANAGISVGVDLSEPEDLQALHDVLATNVVGVAGTFSPFIEPMRQRRSGRLVGVASVAAIRGLPGHGAYCASKSGVVALCESLRVECRGQGVQVLTILPGYIATPLTSRNRYAMPFLMTAEAFADRAFRAIEAGDSYRVIPWQMGWVARLLRWLPNRVYDRLLARRGRKARRPPGEA